MSNKNIMLQLYSYDNKKLIINDSFSELWSIMKFRGKYIEFPKPIGDIIKKIPEKIIYLGKLNKDRKFYFRNISNDVIINTCGNEIQLSVDYDYEIEWEINSKCKCKTKIDIGFYSPYRKFSNDRLYLNFDKNQKKLTKYSCLSGKILIDCHILVIALNKYHHKTNIILTINPILKNSDISSLSNIEYCKVKIFDLKKDGIFYIPLIKKEFKKLYKSVRKYYEFTSIERNNNKFLSKGRDGFLPNDKPQKMCTFSVDDSFKNHLSVEESNSLLPKEIDYTGILSKMSYDYRSILSFTYNIQPITDRIGYYGIIIKRDPNIISSATINYEFELNNIYKTDDIIVKAAYYQPGEGLVLHQRCDKKTNKCVYVNNYFNDGPYPIKSNYISSQLILESTAVDIVLIITNSFYGILPVNEHLPIGKFTKFNIEYDNIQR